MVTRVVHISAFPLSRVTVFHVEGDATVDEGDACLIGQTVIDISRFHFRYSCLFCPPLFNGVGGAVRFLVVGTIGQEERPPRGQLWMEQCLTSLKYWPI